MLDLAKVEAGAVELEELTFDVREVVRGRAAAGPLRRGGPRAHPRGPRARRPAPHRLGDPGRLRQVLTNLAGNAVKFTEAGSVTVLLEGDAAGLVLSVRDTGIGLTAEQQDRLFAPFVQADAATTRRYGGTGLGLSIARGLVERMGGTISVTSVPGEGSTFRVALPLPAVEPPAVRAPDPAPAQVPGRLRVLLAEDNLVNQLVATATLERLGVSVDVVGDGAAAVQAVLDGHYDAVLMDVQMPRMDGLSATRWIRAVESGTLELTGAGATRLPIVAMTASALQSDQQACADAGMDGVLPKPWTEQQLHDVLQRLSRRAALQH